MKSQVNIHVTNQAACSRIFGDLEAGTWFRTGAGLNPPPIWIKLQLPTTKHNAVTPTGTFYLFNYDKKIEQVFNAEICLTEVPQ